MRAGRGSILEGRGEVETRLNELLEGPCSEHADWGQCWLGPKMDSRRLGLAEHQGLSDNPAPGTGAEPPDEFIVLIYDRTVAPVARERVLDAIRIE